MAVYVKTASSAVRLSDELENTAAAHNSEPRLTYMGTEFTAEHAEIIANAAWNEGIYPGCYWKIEGYNWRIYHLDPQYGKGDTSCTTHHVAIIPDTNLYTAPMNSTNVTTGAYVGSAMYTCEDCVVSDVTYNGLQKAKELIESIFGDYLLTVRTYLQNTCASGYPTSGAWYDSTVDLMNEETVYGCCIRQQMPYGGNYINNVTNENFQYALFQHCPQFINYNRSWYWLRDVCSSANFCSVYGVGTAANFSASDVYGVRPRCFLS